MSQQQEHGPTPSSSSQAMAPETAAAAAAAERGSESAALPDAKLTPSCSRCRTKKLRCHYDEGVASCTNCIGKGLEDECHRDVRVPRGRKRSRREDGISSGLGPLNAEDPASDRLGEIARLKRRLAELEGVPPPAHPAYAQRTSSSSSSSSSSAPSRRMKSAPRGPAPIPSRSDTEDAALMLESLAFTHHHRVSARFASSTTNAEDGGRRRLTMADDQAGSQWTSSSSLSESLGLVRSAKQDVYASDGVIVEELITTFLRRVTHNVGHVIYGPGIKRASQAFLSMSEEEIIVSDLFVDPCTLACLLLVLCLGFEFHPSTMIANAPPSPGWRAVEHLRKQGIDPSTRWYDLAKKCLKVEASFELTSVAALQATCLLLFRGKETVARNRMLLNVAVSSAQDFGLHRLGEARRKSDMDVNDFIRLETGVRIWTYLCIYDWSSAGTHGLTYMIQPSQTTTRMPLNINDDGLEKADGREEPLERWTEGAYVIAQYQLAECVRDSVDVRNEQAVQVSRSEQEDQIVDDEKHEDRTRKFAVVGSLASLSEENRNKVQARIMAFVEELPRFFHLDSDVAHPPVVPVQRWLLHQQIFDVLMKLNRGRLATEEGREKCLMLAHHILDQQVEIRSVCPIVDHFAVHSSHTYSACIIVLLDLIARPSQGDLETRHWARERVVRAIKGLRNSGWISTGVRVLEVLMAHEEEQYSLSTTGQVVQGRRPILSDVARKLVREIGGASQSHTRQHPSTDWPAAQQPSGPVSIARETSGEVKRRQYDTTMLPVLGAFPPARLSSPSLWPQEAIADNQAPVTASRRTSQIASSSRSSSTPRTTSSSSMTSPTGSITLKGGHDHAHVAVTQPTSLATIPSQEPLAGSVGLDFGMVLDWAVSLGFANSQPEDGKMNGDVAAKIQKQHLPQHVVGVDHVQSTAVQQQQRAKVLQPRSPVSQHAHAYAMQPPLGPPNHYLPHGHFAHHQSSQLEGHQQQLYPPHQPQYQQQLPTSFGSPSSGQDRHFIPPQHPLHPQQQQPPFQPKFLSSDQQYKPQAVYRSWT